MKAFAKIKPKSNNKTVVQNKAVLEIVYRPQIYITAEGIIQPYPRVLKNHVIETKSRQVERHTIQKPILNIPNQQKEKPKQAVSSGISSISNSYSVKLEQEQHKIQQTKVQTLSFSNLIPQQKKIQPKQQIQSIIEPSPQPRKRRQIFSAQSKLANKLKILETPRRDKINTNDSQKQAMEINIKEQQMAGIEQSPVQIYNANNYKILQKSQSQTQSRIAKWPIQQNKQQDISCFEYFFNRDNDQPTARKQHRGIFNKNRNAFTKKQNYIQEEIVDRSNPPQKSTIKQKPRSQNKMIRIYKNYSMVGFRNNVIKLGQYRAKQPQQQQLRRSKIHSASYKVNSIKSSSSISIQVISVQYGAPFAF